MPATAGRTIPFDYSFVFELGRDPRRRQHRKTVTVSIESAFVGVSIGYGLVPPAPVRFGLSDTASTSSAATAAGSGGGVLALVSGGAGTGVLTMPTVPGAAVLRGVSFSRLPMLDVIRGFREVATGREALMTARVGTLNPLAVGVRLNPRLVPLFEVADPNIDVELDEDAATELFELTTTPVEDVQFKYALFDDGSGREYQSEPVLSTAGLGMPKGERPFRYFATPIRFEPQTTIRLEVTEVTPFNGELHIVLHGYKIVGSAAPTARRAARERRLTRHRR